MRIWARTVQAIAVWARRIWAGAHLVAFVLLHQGYASTHCGAGYVVTWVDFAAIRFLMALAFPWMHLPSWLHTVLSPHGPLVDAFDAMLPRLSEDFCSAALLELNFQLIAIPIAAVACLARRAAEPLAHSLSLPNER